MRSDQQTFDSMVDFAVALPAMRRRVKRDLAGDELTRERVLACATRLLDPGFFRIGSEEYAERNDSYGVIRALKRRRGPWASRLLRRFGGERIFVER